MLLVGLAAAGNRDRVRRSTESRHRTVDGRGGRDDRGRRHARGRHRILDDRRGRVSGSIRGSGLSTLRTYRRGRGGGAQRHPAPGRGARGDRRARPARRSARRSFGANARRAASPTPWHPSSGRRISSCTARTSSVPVPRGCCRRAPVRSRFRGSLHPSSSTGPTTRIATAPHRRATSPGGWIGARGPAGSGWCGPGIPNARDKMRVRDQRAE